MVDPIIPLAERSLRFMDGMFQGTVNAGDAQTCWQAARAARRAAAASDNPLLCIARAAWWAAVADRCAADYPRQVERVESCRPG